tara:strand:+ start:518 stop:1015 length:498 start_codon:yes stop_codon:yes gene_type:complete
MGRANRRRDWCSYSTENTMTSEKTQKILQGLQEINKPKKAEAIIKPVSNIYGEDANGRPIYIDRLYGSITGQHELINKNGTVYKGKINRKRRLVKLKQINGTVNNVYSVCFQTTDGRWFNNCGMPIEAPKKVEEDEPVDTVEVQKTELTPEEKIQIEKDLLSKLK